MINSQSDVGRYVWVYGIMPSSRARPLGRGIQTGDGVKINDYVTGISGVFPNDEFDHDCLHYSLVLDLRKYSS